MNIVLNIILGKMFGVYGIIVATLISLFIINFGFGSQILFNKYFKNGKIFQYFREHFIYMFVTVAIAIITIVVCSLIKGNEWFELIVRGIICCFVPNLLYLLLYHKTKMYQEAVPWFLNKTGVYGKIKFVLSRKEKHGKGN